MKKSLLILWQAPQMLVGYLVKKFTKATKVGDHYTYNLTSGSVSLGEYVFLCPAHQNSEEVLKHEKGHSKQSRILGWFYLLVIGLPSIVWARCFEEYRQKHNINYYSFYTEKWADKLGGVDR